MPPVVIPPVVPAPASVARLVFSSAIITALVPMDMTDAGQVVSVGSVGSDPGLIMTNPTTIKSGFSSVLLSYNLELVTASTTGDLLCRIASSNLAFSNARGYCRTVVTTTGNVVYMNLVANIINFAKAAVVVPSLIVGYNGTSALNLITSSSTLMVTALP